MSNKYYSPQNLVWVSNLMFAEAGIKIGVEKGYLIETRLSPLVRKNNFKDIEGFIESAKMGNAIHKQELIDALTTNETSFFRDNKPFEILEKITIPEFIEKNKNTKTLRIWSAACSSGQEAYSIKIILDRFAELNNWNIQIVGTDISKEIVKKATEGLYSQFEIQRGLPTKELIKYFDKNGTEWKAKQSLKQNITFRVENIFRPMNMIGKFDIVFCRNLLIYFDLPHKQKALSNIHMQMNPNGHLFIGGAETLLGIHNGFKLRKEFHGLYEKQ